MHEWAKRTVHERTGRTVWSFAVVGLLHGVDPGFVAYVCALCLCLCLCLWPCLPYPCYHSLRMLHPPRPPTVWQEAHMVLQLGPGGCVRSLAALAHQALVLQPRRLAPQPMVQAVHAVWLCSHAVLHHVRHRHLFCTYSLPTSSPVALSRSRVPSQCDVADDRCGDQHPCVLLVPVPRAYPSTGCHPPAAAVPSAGMGRALQRQPRGCQLRCQPHFRDACGRVLHCQARCDQQGSRSRRPHTRRSRCRCRCSRFTCSRCSRCWRRSRRQWRGW